MIVGVVVKEYYIMLQGRKVSDFHRGKYLLLERNEGSKITRGEIDCSPMQHTILFSRFQLKSPN